MGSARRHRNAEFRERLIEDSEPAARRKHLKLRFTPTRCCCQHFREKVVCLYLAFISI